MKFACAVVALTVSGMILNLHFRDTMGQIPVQVVVPQGIESVNGSDVNMGCTSPLVDSGDGVMVCSSGCSTLFDGISPTINTSTSDWASQLVTVRRTEHDNIPYTRVLLTFGFDTAVTVTGIELDLFLCPEWNIGAPVITVYANRENNLNFFNDLPSQTISILSESSCDSLSTVTITLREVLTQSSFLTWHILMSQFGDAEWAHVGEVRFLGEDGIPNCAVELSTMTSTPIQPESLTMKPLSATEVEISWKGRGGLFISLQYTTYYTVTGAVMRQDEITLQPGIINSIFITLDDAAPGYQHNFTLHYIFRDGTHGPLTTATFSFDKKYFQIQFGPINYCLKWGLKRTMHFEDQLQSQLIRIIRERCTDCYNFTTSYLKRGTFLCHDNPTTVTYRSTLINPFPTTNSTQLVGTIQSWVSSSPSLILDGLLVRVSPSCPTCIGSLDDDECVDAVLRNG